MSSLSKQSTTVVYQYRCKICQYAQSHPDLFKELHQLVLESNLSFTRAMNIINDRIAQQNIDIPKLNNQNMTVHFNNHISLSDRLPSEAQKQLAGSNPALRFVNPDVGMFVEDMIRRKLGNDVNDYLNLDRIRSMLMEKLEILDGITESVNLDGSVSVDLSAMDRYVAVIREIRSCITDLNKIRQSKQLVSMVIKSLVEKNTMDIVRQMAREHDQVMKDLIDAGVDAKLVDNIKLKLGMRLAEVVAVTARNAVSDVLRSYKLE